MRVENGECDLGILICGAANGVAITANKHQGIRAAICWKDEIAVLARSHNNANIVCVPCPLYVRRSEGHSNNIFGYRI
jgi:ribose 5-phosphate isomerase B